MLFWKLHFHTYATLMSRSGPFCFLLCIVLATVSLGARAQQQDELPRASPESRGYSSALLKKVGADANRQVPNLGAFLVWKHDALIYEGYFHGFTKDSVFNIKSASKTVLSAITGAAIARGYLPDLDTPVLKILPEYGHSRHAAGMWFSADNEVDDRIRQLLTMRELMTMQTGLAWDDFGPLANAWCSSSDPVRLTLDIEYDTLPGTQFRYCSGGAHVFGVALARLIGSDLWGFADSTLFKPAGMQLRRWNTDPMGRYIGGCDMYFTPQDMMRFGILYLNNGKVNGRQILPQSWIKESMSSHAVLKYWDVLPGANGYGYFWWRRKSHGNQVYVASGICGELICVVPDLAMVIVTACSTGENAGRAEIKKLHLEMDKILAAAKL